VTKDARRLYRSIVAQTLELPAKSTRDMSASKIRADAARFGVAQNGDIEALRVCAEA
jgi:hypothetical protein